jgi:hypothetical protein
MPNTAPGAERVAGNVHEDAKPAVAARPVRRVWRWAGLAVFLLVVAVLFDAYLHLSKTYQENSDEANILLMANDMLHGNIMLQGWFVSDVPFISTELPQIAMLVWIFGLHLDTAHIAAAMTYTLVVAFAMVLAKGKAHGWAAVARMALALGIMLAPQTGVGVFVDIFSVGHIGTALPVMLTWLVVDRLGRRPYVPVIVAVLLGWAETADPLVLVIAIFPLFAICAARLATGLVVSVRERGQRGLWRALGRGAAGRWFELALAAAGGAGYAIAWGASQFIKNSNGYFQYAVPYKLDPARNWLWQARVVVHGLLEMFGAYFVSGNPKDPQAQQALISPLSGLDQAIAVTRLVVVVLAVWGCAAIARRLFFRDADIVSQLLLAGIVANLFAYIPSTLANNVSALNTREIAPVLPFAAVLAGRMLGDRLLRGPRVTIRLPGRRFGLRLVAGSLVALMGWYGYGLWRQADTPAAPEPYAQLAAYLEQNHLDNGLGGYWQASVITVETGGKVTIRAVTPACLQPYLWESKSEWYDPSREHPANFLLLSNVPGYFNKYAVSPAVLQALNYWFGKPKYSHYPKYYGTGGVATIKSGDVIYNYQVRKYPTNLLAQLPQLQKLLSSPPPHWLVERMSGQPITACQ